MSAQPQRDHREALDQMTASVLHQHGATLVGIERSIGQLAEAVATMIGTMARLESKLDALAEVMR